MKKQQWLFKQVFSMINSSSSTSSSFNNVRGRRPFCSAAATTNTSLFAAAPTDVAPPVQQQQLNILLEKKLPLLIVPYDHVTQQKYVQCPHRELVGGGSICDGTLGFISLFHDHHHHDEEIDDQLVINNNKEEKKEVEIYKVYLPEIAKRRICGSSEGWLVTIHENGEFQLLNPVTRVILHLPPLTAFPGVSAKFALDKGKDSTLFYLTDKDIEPPYPRFGSHHFREIFIHKVVTNTTTTTTNSATLPAAATVVVMAIYGTDKHLAFCRMSSSSIGNGSINDDDDGTDEPEAKRWIMIPTAGYSYVRRSWEDITFYKGNFYAISPVGYVGVVKNLDGPSPFVQIIIDCKSPSCFYSVDYYLVGSSSSSSSSGGGDLLMVKRNVIYGGEEEEEETEVETEEDKTDEEEEEEEEETAVEEKEEIFDHSYRTIGFQVWKLDLNGRPRPKKEERKNGQRVPSWEEVKDLGEDCALFIGYNHSFSFSASKFPSCRGNCIYFTDNSHDKIFVNPIGGHDIGVYNLEDGSVEKLNYETSSSQLFMPPPVWYVPY